MQTNVLSALRTAQIADGAFCVATAHHVYMANKTESKLNIKSHITEPLISPVKLGSTHNPERCGLSTFKHTHTCVATNATGNTTLTYDISDNTAMKDKIMHCNVAVEQKCVSDVTGMALRSSDDGVTNFYFTPDLVSKYPEPKGAINEVADVQRNDFRNLSTNSLFTNPANDSLYLTGSSNLLRKFQLSRTLADCSVLVTLLPGRLFFFLFSFGFLF